MTNANESNEGGARVPRVIKLPTAELRLRTYLSLRGFEIAGLSTDEGEAVLSMRQSSTVTPDSLVDGEGDSIPGSSELWLDGGFFNGPGVPSAYPRSRPAVVSLAERLGEDLRREEPEHYRQSYALEILARLWNWIATGSILFRFEREDDEVAPTTVVVDERLGELDPDEAREGFEEVKKKARDLERVARAEKLEAGLKFADANGFGIVRATLEAHAEKLREVGGALSQKLSEAMSAPSARRDFADAEESGVPVFSAVVRAVTPRGAVADLVLPAAPAEAFEERVKLALRQAEERAAQERRQAGEPEPEPETKPDVTLGGRMDA